jgi:hypothetical protein
MLQFQVIIFKENVSFDAAVKGTKFYLKGSRKRLGVQTYEVSKT